MKCWNCGTDVPEGGEYCPICGCKQMILYKNEDLFNTDLSERQKIRTGPAEKSRPEKQKSTRPKPARPKPSRQIYDDINDGDRDDWSEEENFKEGRSREERSRGERSREGRPREERIREERTVRAASPAQKRQPSGRRPQKDNNSILKKGIIAAAVIAAVGILIFVIVTHATGKKEGPSPQLSEEMQQQINANQQTPSATGQPVPEETYAPVSEATPEATPEPTPEAQEQITETPAPEELTASLATASYEDTNGYTRIAVADARASSVIVQEGIDNSPGMMLDGDQTTSWQEGVDGYGEGEVLQFDLAQQSNIHCLTFKLGNWRDPQNFKDNSRPKGMTIWLDDTSFQVEFPDGMNEYSLRLSNDVPCSVVYVRIESVYPGDAYQDTCISEIGIYGS